MKLIVAMDSRGGIAKNGTIPWNNPADLKQFKQLTTSGQNPVIVMGSKTWYSLPKRPLPNRVNVIIGRRPLEETDGIWFSSPIDFLSSFNDLSNVWIIGGKQIYEWFIQHDYIKEYHITHIAGDHDCDLFLSTNKEEQNYLNVVQNILNNGQIRKDRTGTGTLATFGTQFVFNIRESIPLLTTKRVYFRSVAHELVMMLRGITDSKWLEERKVNIWKKNTSRESLDQYGKKHYKEGDMGPMYGWQWRHFGAQYRGCDADYTGEGIDQLEEVIQLIKTDPYSRRILMTTYDVRTKQDGVLYPCHGLVVQFFCEDREDGKWLSCHMYQRSMDLFLGAPFNFASYALLTYIIAQKTGRKPDKLFISSGDTHIYSNLIEQCKLQLTRVPCYPFPKLVVDCEKKSWDEIEPSDFKLIDYKCQAPIKGEMSV